MTAVALDIALRQGFGLVILLVLPLVVGAVAASATAGLLANRVGLQDSTVTMVARALGCVLALGLTFETLGSEALSFTRELWSDLGSVAVSVPTSADADER